MAYRGLALALLLVAFSSGEIHDATENLPNAGDSVELLSESTAAPEAHASPDGKGAEKVNEKGAATEEEAPGTTINEVNKEAAAATEEEAAATTTNNEVNEKAAATEEEAAATTTNKVAAKPVTPIGESEAVESKAGVQTGWDHTGGYLWSWAPGSPDTEVALSPADGSLTCEDTPQSDWGHTCFSARATGNCANHPHPGNCDLTCGVCKAYRPPIMKVFQGTSKVWVGAFSSTHADENPVSDGAPLSASASNCLTQIGFRHGPHWFRNEGTCTSCKEGYSFKIMNHKARMGECVPYEPTPDELCVKVNGGIEGSADSNVAKVCTKTVEVQSVLNPSGLEPQAKEDHFASVKGHMGVAIAKCAVRKETVCDADGHCDSEKDVRCVSVCKMAHDMKADEATCDATKCDGDYGALSCVNAALMA